MPLLAHAVDQLFGGSLVWLRFPAALAGAATVLVCGLMAREFGDGRAAQLLAASCLAVSSIAMAVGHLLSTSTFDLLIWTTLSWLLIRVLKDPSRSWLPVGLVAGVGLETKTLVAFFLIAVGLALVLVGPRRVLLSRLLWAAAAVALLLWAPNLWWQGTHGWPQLELSRAIASGSSGTSQSRWAFLPFQLVLVSPVLVPVWLAGLWRLAKDKALTPYRFFAVAYVVLAVVFLMTGGKPYYLAGTTTSLRPTGRTRYSSPETMGKPAPFSASDPVSRRSTAATTRTASGDHRLLARAPWSRSATTLEGSGGGSHVSSESRQFEIRPRQQRRSGAAGVAVSKAP